MIVTDGVAFDLVDALADGGGSGEIHGGARDGFDFAGGDQRVVHGDELRGGNHHLVSEDGSRAGEVEVGVIGQVDRRGFVGRGGVVDDEFVVVRERVDNRNVEVAGITFFAIGTLAREFDGRVFAGGCFGLPVGLVETFASAVQMMGAVVGGEAVFLAVELEAPMGDAIGAASDDAAEIRTVVLDVAIERIEAEGDVAGAAVSVGSFERDESRAVVHHGSGHAVLVAQGEQGDDGMVGEFPE